MQGESRWLGCGRMERKAVQGNGEGNEGGRPGSIDRTICVNSHSSKGSIVNNIATVPHTGQYNSPSTSTASVSAAPIILKSADVLCPFVVVAGLRY